MKLADLFYRMERMLHMCLQTSQLQLPSSNGSQNMIPRPAAWALHGNLLEVQFSKSAQTHWIRKHQKRSSLPFNKSLRWFWCPLKSEDHGENDWGYKCHQIYSFCHSLATHMPLGAHKYLPLRHSFQGKQKEKDGGKIKGCTNLKSLTTEKREVVVTLSSCGIGKTVYRLRCDLWTRCL